MELPAMLLELTASRIPPHFMTRAAIQSEVFDPDQAVAAGFLDEVVDAQEIDARALAVAQTLADASGDAELLALVDSLRAASADRVRFTPAGRALE